MHARTELEVGLDHTGRSVLQRMRCEVPLVVRVDTHCTDVLSLLVVNAAAGPLSGDMFELSLVVHDGASVRVRSVGANLVQPGPNGGQSATTTTVRVGEGARLDWELEPTVSVQGSHHRALTSIDAATTATVRFVDAVALGRFNEPGGLLSLRQRLTVGGRAVLDHATEFGPGAAMGPGAHGDMRHICSTVIVSDDAPVAASSDVRPTLLAGVFPLAERCALMVVTARSLV
ncbi:MAG: urease accessory protein UreD [Actinomycetota bacterium]